MLEAWACQHARELGAPVPRVFAVDLARETYPRDFILLEDVTGDPLPHAGLSAASRERLGREAGQALRRVHEIGVPGFGLLDESTYLRTAHVQGRYDTWDARLREALDSVLPALVTAGLLSGAGAERAETVAAAHVDLFDIGPVGHLLHGSFEPSRVLVRDGELAALVDFGDRQSGDPAWDLGSFLVRDAAGMAPLLAGYEPGRDRAALMETTVPLYGAFRALEWAHRAFLDEDRDDCDVLLETADAAFRALGHP